MKIYPDFYNQFQCIGMNCQNTCCAGWTITLDSETAQFYESRTDEFGVGLRQKLTDIKGQKAILMTPENRCPFLNENELCEIFIHYGEDHLSQTCQNFPRRGLVQGDNELYALSLSCEQVLQILYKLPSAFRCTAEGNPQITTLDDLMVYEIAQYIAWGIELLQDPSISLGTALGTVLYVGMEAADSFKKQEFEKFESVILQAPEILEQFQQTEKECTSAVFSESAWNLLFGIADTFCHIVKEAGLYGWKDFLWPDHVFGWKDAQRKDYLLSCVKNQKSSAEHKAFTRKLAALCFFGHSLALETETAENIYLRDMSNLILLTELLPATWNISEEKELSRYLSRLSHISRRFEQSNVVKKFVYPVIQDLFHPDIYSYVSAFMVLFDS